MTVKIETTAVKMLVRNRSLFPNQMMAMLGLEQLDEVLMCDPLLFKVSHVDAVVRTYHAVASCL